jgi:hypothetical protein
LHRAQAVGGAEVFDGSSLEVPWCRAQAVGEAKLLRRQSWLVSYVVVGGDWSIGGGFNCSVAL